MIGIIHNSIPIFHSAFCFKFYDVWSSRETLIQLIWLIWRIMQCCICSRITSLIRYIGRLYITISIEVSVDERRWNNLWNKRTPARREAQTIYSLNNAIDCNVHRRRFCFIYFSLSFYFHSLGYWKKKIQHGEILFLGTVIGELYGFQFHRAYNNWIPHPPEFCRIHES